MESKGEKCDTDLLCSCIRPVNKQTCIYEDELLYLLLNNLKPLCTVGVRRIVESSTLHYFKNNKELTKTVPHKSLECTRNYSI